MFFFFNIPLSLLQDAINAVDCMSKMKPVSSSSDRSVRVWKVQDQSHLVLRGHKNNIDCIKCLTDDHFLSAGQDGFLNLWKDTQKTPISSVPVAHGTHPESCRNPRWISSLATIPMSDLAATGSNDGAVRVWSVGYETRKLKCVNSFPVVGFVNCLAFTPNMVVAGTGAEHRMGRWWNLKGNKNKLVVTRFNESLSSQVEEKDDEEGEGDEDEEESDSDRKSGSVDEENDSEHSESESSS
jgi:ribosomal RNA-processing protein 9